MNASTENFIGIEDLDAPIYRIFSFDRFCELLQSGNLVLVEPRLWEDPLENVLMNCAILDTSKTPYGQHFFHEIRQPIYAQCWSMTKESDTLLRAYSIVKKNTSGRNKFRELEGVQVKSTPRKLLEALWSAVPTHQADTCFFGKVKYQPEAEFLRYFNDEIVSQRLQAFDGGLGQARSVLHKRDPFSYENEVRLIYVGNKSQQSSSGIFCIPVKPNVLFDEVLVDPRLATGERLERAEEIRKLGFSGPIETDSRFYKKFLFEIPLDLGAK